MPSIIESLMDPENRKQEVCDFFGYPRELVDALFKYSKEYFEEPWERFYPNHVSTYYAAGFYIIRQMSYSLKDVFTDRMLDWLEKVEGSCTDYGCGVGDLLIYLAKRGVDCIAVEHRGLPVEFLEWRFRRYGVEVLVLPEGHFVESDYSLAISSLDHVASPIDFAKHLTRCTRRKIFATPCIDETYDRPTHIKEILADVPEAFRIINEFNARKM